MLLIHHEPYEANLRYQAGRYYEKVPPETEVEFANVPDIGEFSERERESQPSSSKRLKRDCFIACCPLRPRDPANDKLIKVP